MTTRHMHLVSFDGQIRREGFAYVAGADEAGRGCLAGPIVAAAVVLASGVGLSGANDSKQLTPKARDEQAIRIRASALAFAFAFASPRSIDRHNVRRANLMALARAVARVRSVATRRMGDPATVLLLVDGNDPIPDTAWPQRTVVDGDAKSLAVACASIIAKTVRDRFMQRLHAHFPEYGFERHKGYGTEEHLAALERLGPCPWHRHTFAPVAQPSLFPR